MKRPSAACRARPIFLGDRGAFPEVFLGEGTPWRLREMRWGLSCGLLEVASAFDERLLSASSELQAASLDGPRAFSAAERACTSRQ